MEKTRAHRFPSIVKRLQWIVIAVVVCCGMILPVGYATTVRLKSTGHLPKKSLENTAWYDRAWRYRKAIEIDNTHSAPQLTQYQVKISLTAENFPFGHTLADGSDIRVTDSDALTLIPYYILSYNKSIKVATIWARVPDIAANSQKTIYLYYGNPAPNPFLLPPTGLFTRPSRSVMGGLGEDMVYDPKTKRYYEVFTIGYRGPIGMASAPTPNGPWTNDGIILRYSASGQWDDQSLYAPHLLESNGVWYLYYSGGQAPGGLDDRDSIGVATATSVLGPYTRYVNNPVVTYSKTPGDWDAHRACEPYIYHSNILHKWVMFYMGDASNGQPEHIEQVGYATASDPLGPWTKDARNPIIPFSPAPAWDSGTVADPFAVEVGGITYIGYTGATGTNGSSSHWMIGFASTKDFRTFTKIGQVYGRGATGEWDVNTAFRGAVSLFGDTWYLPYASNGSFGTDWGVATMSALSTARGYDPFQVFDYYDDFSGSKLNANIWGQPGWGNKPGHQVVNNHTLTLDSGAWAANSLIGRREFGVGYVVEVTSRDLNADGTGNHKGAMGLALDDLSQTIGIMDDNSPDWLKSSGRGPSARSATHSNMRQRIDNASWHVHRIAFFSPKLILYQNDQNPWEQLTTNIPVSSLKPWLFSSSSTGKNASMEFGTFIVRKYTNPEPVLTIGPERTMPVIPYTSFGFRQGCCRMARLADAPTP